VRLRLPLQGEVALLDWVRLLDCLFFLLCCGFSLGSMYFYEVDDESFEFSP
jgi:hypothetical protein